MLGFPLKTIMVAADFSKNISPEWDYAKTLAETLGATLKAINVRPSALPSDVVEDILKASIRCSAELIIIGTKDRSALQRLTHPSVAEAIVRASPIPVLTLRGPGNVPRSLLVPMNLEDYSLAGFQFAEQMAKALQAKITVFWVRDRRLRPEAPLRRLTLAMEAARAVLPVEGKIGFGDPVDSMVKEAIKHDLVVLVAHRKGIFHDALLGTTAEQVLRRSPVPVLSVPIPSAEPFRKRKANRGTRREFLGPEARARRRQRQWHSWRT